MDPRRLLPPLAAATAAVAVATLVALGWRTLSSGGDTAGAGGSGDRANPSQVHASASSPAAVLSGWDAARARAWAGGDAAALRRLYVEGSRVGEADVALLRGYVRRGLRVTGLQTQVLDLEVVDEGARRLRVVVTDRVVGGVAVGAGRTVALPRDRPSTRSVVLVRVADRWLVERVRDVPHRPRQPSAADSTSRTSRSSKS